ncbi:MAG: FAD-dependent oxidoreductase, partial [Pseudomonadota bacterium]
TLIDPREHHLKITRLHETVRRPLRDVRIPFSVLGERFGFRHIQQAMTFNEDALRLWQLDRAVPVGSETVGFDYLLIATGSAANKSQKDENVFDLDDVSEQDASDLLETLFSLPDVTPAPITVVGGGATGIQFLFEIAHVLRTRRLGNPLNLVDSEDSVLKQFPGDFNSYVQARMAEKDIGYFPGRFFQGKEGDCVVLEDPQSGTRSEVASGLTFLFLGKTPSDLLMADSFGHVLLGGRETLENMFTAGDCSYFKSLGSNVLTAQSAVRKGMTVARNILRQHGDVILPLPYVYQDLGYLVSLGPSDAIGWLGLKRNIVAGFPAFVLKELVEAQYDLLLSGIDTYVV